VTFLDDMAHRNRPPGPVAKRGKVRKAPDDADSPLTVTLVNFSQKYSYEVPAGQWMPRGDDLPIDGDTCLVVFDDNGDTWVSAWSPSG
jgi:hypothetical protein